MRALSAVVLAVAVTACASIPPSADIQAGDRCARCRRAISDLRLAAVDGDGGAPRRCRARDDGDDGEAGDETRDGRN